MQIITENYTGNFKNKENKLLAYCWFTLSALLAITPFISFSGKAYLLIPGFLGLSAILFMIGRQRLNKYVIKEEKLNVLIRNLAIFVAIYSGASVAIMQKF
ncbi:Uncharacterised protein [Shewanella morhuae]|uniref:Uncharacterized protein n=2 Tax=Shewanella morhuae TaxID=365591 RepID=A0A380C806_9GAMM|nr:Uncharacterised protein [Shewanella morhuae]